MRKLLPSLSLLLAGAIGLALAQTTPLYNWLGTETLKLTLGSGSVVETNLNMIRVTRSVSPVSATTTSNISPTGAAPNFGILLATGAITTWNNTFPNPAYEGQEVCLANGTGSDFTTNTSIGVAPSGTQTQTLNTAFQAQTITAGGRACFVFRFNAGSSTTGVWFRVQ